MKNNLPSKELTKRKHLYCNILHYIKL